MKVIAAFPAKKKIELIDCRAPRIVRPTDVKVRVLEVGICGTDRDVARFKYGTPPSGSDYLIMGHECLAEVVEIGRRVSGIRVGDLVVPMVRRPCRHKRCFACRAGRQDFCITGDYSERGIKRAHGFMAETVVDDEKYFNRVPKPLRDIGVLTEPLTIATKALSQIWQVQERLPWGPGKKGQKKGYRHQAVVVGAGPVGLLGALALAHAGFRTWVYSLEPADSLEAAVVRSAGATYVSSSKVPLKDLVRRFDNLDLVFEATGASKISFRVLEVLGTNGIMVLTGIPGIKGPIETDADKIMRNMVLKNQVFFGTVNAGLDDYKSSIRDLRAFDRKWSRPIRSLITGRFGMESFEDLLTQPKKGIKNVLMLC